MAQLCVCVAAHSAQEGEVVRQLLARAVVQQDARRTDRNERHNDHCIDKNADGGHDSRQAQEGLKKQPRQLVVLDLPQVLALDKRERRLDTKADSHVEPQRKNEEWRIEGVPDDLKLSDVAALLTVGGDGAVAFVVHAFFRNRLENREGFNNGLRGLPPLLPVMRARSVGFLKQLDMDPDTFLEGMEHFLADNYELHGRTVLRASVLPTGEEFVAVNEVVLRSDPVLGKFDLFYGDISRDDESAHIAHQWADGVMISTAIGSTAWALSHGGQINLNEGALGVVFIGGTHGSHNLTVPTRPLRASLELKNSSITQDTVLAFHKACARRGITREDAHTEAKLSEILEITFGSRLVVDGKVVAFDLSEIAIDCSDHIRFITLPNQSEVSKTRNLSNFSKAKF